MLFVAVAFLTFLGAALISASVFMAVRCNAPLLIHALLGVSAGVLFAQAILLAKR